MYAYQAQRDDELSFAVDDVITVLECCGSDWWRGQLRGQIGMFPSNYVVAVVEPEPVNSDLAVSLAVHRMYSVILCYVRKLRMCELKCLNT